MLAVGEANHNTVPVIQMPKKSKYINVRLYVNLCEHFFNAK
jgi:hypothetical protein